jgi:hypothetical protein
MDGLRDIEGVIEAAVIFSPSDEIKPEHLHLERDPLDETADMVRVVEAKLKECWDKFDHEADYSRHRKTRRLC